MTKNETTVEEQMKDMEALREELKAMQEALTKQKEDIEKDMEDLKAERIALTEETSKLLAAKTALDETQVSKGVKQPVKPVTMHF